MGRGHSGSTVLDALLGNAESIESIGELVSGLERETEICSCGKAYRRCGFWLRVIAEFRKKSEINIELGASLMRRQAHIRRFTKYIIARPNSQDVQVLKQINNAIFASLQKASGKKCIVDSSKEHTRALFLMRFMPNVKIIHLVRNPKGILASTLYRVKEGKGFKFLRRRYFSPRMTGFYMALTSVNWVIGCLIAEIVKLYDPGRVIRLRFEDLCHDTRNEMERIAKFIGHDISQVITNIESGQEMSIGHNIGGNMMRKSGRFKFDPNAEKKRFLPYRYKILANLITWPFMLLYGYHMTR